MTTKPTALPEPLGSIAFASDGYDGEWVSSQGAYSEDQMRDYGRAVRLEALEDAASWLDIYDGPIRARRAEAIRALAKEQQT